MRRNAGGGTIIHTGHNPILPSLMRLGAKHFNEEALSIAKTLLADHSPPSVVDIIIRNITQLSMSRSTMVQIRKNAKAEQHKFATDGSDTVATRALKVLENDEFEYCYITGRFNNALQAVTVKSVSSCRSSKAVEEENVAVIDVGKDERSDFVKETVKGLTLGK